MRRERGVNQEDEREERKDKHWGKEENNREEQNWEKHEGESKEGIKWNDRETDGSQKDERFKSMTL